jgi:hypothetical protein
MLLELKTNTELSLARIVVHQLVGYLLADSDDRYQIRSAGWYFARDGVWWTFPVPVFLDRLAGRHVELSQARGEFTVVAQRLGGRGKRTPG